MYEWGKVSYGMTSKQIKLLSEVFFQFTFNHLRMTQTQEIITCRVLKIHKWIQGDVYEWGKLLKE